MSGRRRGRKGACPDGEGGSAVRLKAWAAVVCAAVLAAAGAVWAAARQDDRILSVLGIGRPVELYFARPDGMGLVAEVHFALPWLDGPMERLRMLARGPRPESGLAPVLPPGARPLRVQVEGDLATVDFSREIVERHWGGSTGELMTVYGIVNTLTRVPGIRRVQILVEGRRVESLVGHVDLTRPLEFDPSLVYSEPGRAQDVARP